MFKILGFCESTGDFSPKDRPDQTFHYSNWCFSFATDENPKMKGLGTSKDGMSLIKIPKDKYTAITGLNTPEELVNKQVSLHYELSYGRAVLRKVEIVK